MITKDTTLIIEHEDFKWNILPESSSLFEQPKVYSVYNPYTIQFKEPQYPNMYRIRRFIYFTINLGNSLLLDAALKLDCNMAASAYPDIYQMLRVAGILGHEKFLEVFKERRHLQYISPTFQPTLDLSVLEQNIQSVVQNGDER